MEIFVMNNLKPNYMTKERSLVGVIILMLISIFILFFGVFGIVENKTPRNLESISTLGISFITYIEYNMMIFMGALGITLAAWFTQNRK